LSRIAPQPFCDFPTFEQQPEGLRLKNHEAGLLVFFNYAGFLANEPSHFRPE
jgi:hypothetical protein